MLPVARPVLRASAYPFKKFMKDNLNAKQYAELCQIYNKLPARSKALLRRSLPFLERQASYNRMVKNGLHAATILAIGMIIIGAAIVGASAALDNEVFSWSGNDLLVNGACLSGLVLCCSGWLGLSAALLSSSIFDRSSANGMYTLLSNMISRQPLNSQEERPVQQVPNVLYLVSNGRNIFATSLAVNHSTSQAEQHGSPCALATIVEEDAEPQATVNDVDAESAVEQFLEPSHTRALL